MAFFFFNLGISLTRPLRFGEPQGNTSASRNVCRESSEKVLPAQRTEVMAREPQQLPDSGGVPGKEANGPEAPPLRVTFPDAFQNQSTVESLKLEVEESAESMSPRNMWQARIIYLFELTSSTLLLRRVCLVSPLLE